MLIIKYYQHILLPNIKMVIISSASLQSYASVLPTLVICSDSATSLTAAEACKYIETMALHAFSRHQ